MGATITQEQGAALIAQRFRRTFSRQALKKHIDKGNLSRCLVRDAAGKITGVDADLLIEEYEVNVNHGRRTDEPSPARQKQSSPPPTSKTAKGQGLPDDAIPDMQISRERHEHYKAEQAKLLVDQQRGELIPLEQVKREAFALAKAVREALLNVPDRVANQLAGEADPAAVHQLLSDELISALGQLANG